VKPTRVRLAGAASERVVCGLKGAWLQIKAQREEVNPPSEGILTRSLTNALGWAEVRHPSASQQRPAMLVPRCPVIEGVRRFVCGVTAITAHGWLGS
jgi:hypothetical protein